MYDVIIKNSLIYEGTLKEPYCADIAIKGSKIVKIQAHIEEDAKESIDASGLALCPGFIDSHSHTDTTVCFYPSNYEKLEQGITSEVVGLCGETLFPVSSTDYDRKNKQMSVSIEKTESFDQSIFTSSKIWMDHLKTLELGTNMFSLIGHGTIRATVMGFEPRHATDAELDEMKTLLVEAFEAGVRGLSTGIAYAPGVFANNDEIKELCKVVAQYKGVYATHMRNQGTDLIKSIEDTISIAKETKCTAIISHLKSIGKPNWGKLKEAVALIERARKDGVDIYCDTYPYLASSTTLQITLPPSVLKGGGSEICKSLADDRMREYVKNQILNPTEKWENAIGCNGFESIFVIEAPETPDAQGRNVAEYAAFLGQDVFITYFDLIIKNNAHVKTINFLMCEEDMLTALTYKNCMIGSDGSTIKNIGQIIHPRNVGTFTKFLGEFVHEKKIMSWTEGIYKCTGLPARVYRLKEKGLIQEGYDADIVIFNAETLKAKSDFKNCFAKNEGIAYVFSSGIKTVVDNIFTGKTGGKLL